MHHHSAVDAFDGRSNVAVRLLGGFELVVDGASVDVVERCQKVIAYLALAGAPQDSSVLAARLWPDSNDVRAGANLRAARWRERNTGSSHVTKIHGTRIQLCDDARVDVSELEASGWCLVEGRPPSTGFDRSHLFMDLLPGWYDDWVIVERERLSQLQLRFAEAYACQVLRQGSLVEAMDVALRLVVADPYRESSHRLLAATYLLDGSAHQAQSQIDRCRQRLLDDLGHTTTLSLAAVRDWISAEMSIE
jgi:DNA-binding SARP family transcriptional activator